MCFSNSKRANGTGASNSGSAGLLGVFGTRPPAGLLANRDGRGPSQSPFGPGQGNGGRGPNSARARDPRLRQYAGAAPEPRNPAQPAAPRPQTNAGWTLINEITPDNPDQKLYKETKTAEDTLRHQMQEVLPRIAALPDDEILTLTDGDQISARQLKAMANGLKVTLTNRDFGEGRGGQVERIFGPDGVVSGADAQFNAEQAYDHVGAGISRVNWYLLHELLHPTDAGVERNRHFWEMRPEGVTAETYPQTTPFLNNEVWANRAARDLARRLGVNIGEDVPRGFEYRQ